MPTETIHCNRCGAQLQVAPTTNFVTCNKCGTQLAIKRSADATYTEAAGEHYNEVAAIDYSYLDVAERLKRLN